MYEGASHLLQTLTHLFYTYLAYSMWLLSTLGFHGYLVYFLLLLGLLAVVYYYYYLKRLAMQGREREIDTLSVRRPRPTLPTYRGKEEKKKIVGQKRREQLG